MHYGFSISHRERTRSVDGRMPSSLEMPRQGDGLGVAAFTVTLPMWAGLKNRSQMAVLSVAKFYSRRNPS